jgi:V/A-type H+/Na+-transporting ATPase subunit E
MPLDRLTERIMREAQEEHDRIIERARAERDTILVDADASAKNIFRRRVRQARNIAEEEKKRSVTVAGLEARKEVLRDKQEMIARVFDLARQAVLDLAEDDYLEFLLALLADVPPCEDAEVVLSPTDRERVGAGLVERANAARVCMDGQPCFRLSEETRDIAVGVVVRCVGLEMNSSVDALIDARREDLESSIVQLLFGGP